MYIISTSEYETSLTLTRIWICTSLKLHFMSLSILTTIMFIIYKFYLHCKCKAEICEDSRSSHINSPTQMDTSSKSSSPYSCIWGNGNWETPGIRRPLLPIKGRWMCRRWSAYSLVFGMRNYAKGRWAIYGSQQHTLQESTEIKIHNGYP